ncbi:MAG: hypothetical protein AABY73_04650 [Pseudomonadota bacterium]
MKRLYNASILFVLALSIFLSGCATNQKLSDVDRKRIDVVKVNDKVEKVPQMFYFGPGAAIGLMFGAIGGAIAGAANIGPGEELLAFAEKNGVRIEEIVSQEFNEALRKSGKVKIVDSQGTKAATINVSVTQFGFSVPHGFSSILVPIVSIKCELIDVDGKVLWIGNDRVLPLGNPVEGIPADEMRQNAKAIESAWRGASKHIVTNIINEL